MGRMFKKYQYNSFLETKNILASKITTYFVHDEWKCTMECIKEMHKQPLNKLLDGITSETLVLSHY
jgi:hypothetical protein